LKPGRTGRLTNLPKSIGRPAEGRPGGSAVPGIRVSEIQFQVDCVVYAIPVVNQNDMSPNDYVTISSGGRSQAARHFIWRWAAQPSHVRIEHVAGLEPALVIVIPLVLLEYLFVLVLAVVLACVLTLMIVELAILLLTLAVILVMLVAVVVVVAISPMVLRRSHACDSKQYYCRSSREPSCSHKFFLHSC